MYKSKSIQLKVSPNPFILYPSTNKIVKKICDECGAQLDDNAQLSVHLREQHRKPYCGPCRTEFKSQEELEEHVRKQHGV